MVVNPAGRPCFFVGAPVDPVSRPRFEAVVGLAVGLGGADGLAIGGAVSTGLDAAVSFSGLSLWYAMTSF